MVSVAVVIVSVERPASLLRLLAALQRQTVWPTQIIICLPRGKQAPFLTKAELASTGLAAIAERVTVVAGTPGACAQRNAGVAALRGSPDIVAMFDDDAIPREDYLGRALTHFEEDPLLVGLTGRVCMDGVPQGRALPEEVMLAALEQSWPGPASRTLDAPLYGCNMAVRYHELALVGFDEALPLYSWLDDRDLSGRLRAFGAIALFTDCVAAHEGNESGGRENHLRFGYSSVMNPVYLNRKGTLRLAEAAILVLRPLLANLRGGVFSGERRRRLAGMALAAGDVLRGRITPERIVDLARADGQVINGG